MLPEPVLKWVADALGCEEREVPQGAVEKLDSAQLMWNGQICVPGHGHDLSESNISLKIINLNEIGSVELLGAPNCTFYENDDPLQPAYIIASWYPGDEEEFYYFEF